MAKQKTIKELEEFIENYQQPDKIPDELYNLIEKARAKGIPWSVINEKIVKPFGFQLSNEALQRRFQRWKSLKNV